MTTPPATVGSNSLQISYDFGSHVGSSVSTPAVQVLDETQKAKESSQELDIQEHHQLAAQLLQDTSEYVLLLPTALNADRDINR